MAQDRVTVQVNTAQLERDFNRFAEAVAKKGIVAAVRAGGRQWKAALAAALDATFTSRTGTLRKNLRTSLRIKGRGVKGVTVKFFAGLSRDAFYGRFWEMGFRHMGRGKGRRLLLRRGGVEGQRMRKEWMRPAAEGAAPGVIETVVTTLRNFIERQGRP
jgi:HK97 gp10 family phage protein